MNLRGQVTKCKFDECDGHIVTKIDWVSYFLSTGIIKQQKKKGQSMKEGKKTQLHNQNLLPQTGLHPQPAVLQPNSQLKQHQQQQQQQHQQQQHQLSPAGFNVPPVAALESSQVLETSFDSLPSFGQPLMHLTHHTGNSSSPAPPHLNTHPAGPVSPETHPFLNQHAILPSPGKAVDRLRQVDKFL